MNPFTVSHLSPMLLSPSLTASPFSTTRASSSAFIPRLDIWLGRSTSLAQSFKIKTRVGGVESPSVISTRRRALLKSDMEAKEEVGSSRSLLQVQLAEELLSYNRRKVESGKLSPDVGHKLEELYYNYQNAILFWPLKIKSVVSIGVGLSVGPEMKFQQVTSNCKEIEEGKEMFSQVLYESVTRQYNALKSAIYGNKGLGASNDSVSLSQPWQS